MRTDSYSDASVLIIDLVTHVMHNQGSTIRQAAFKLLHREGGGFATSPANSAILAARLLHTGGNRAEALSLLSCEPGLRTLLSVAGRRHQDDMGMPQRHADMAKQVRMLDAAAFANDGTAPRPRVLCLAGRIALPRAILPPGYIMHRDARLQRDVSGRLNIAPLILAPSNW